MSDHDARDPRVQLASDSSLLVSFGAGIAAANHAGVTRLFGVLRADPHPAIRNLHPAYGSLLVSFDPRVTHPREMEAVVRARVARLAAATPASPRLHEIPVCYDAAFAPDLGFVAVHTGLAPEAVVRRHSAAEYEVSFIGFSPGFPYLSGLPPELATPRLATPRLHVPAGSVAIGGSQTGIYPTSSPGGWRIIGRTPQRLFDPNLQEPSRLEMGDRLRFRPIAATEFATMETASRS